VDEVEAFLLLAVEQVARVLVERRVEPPLVPEQHGGAEAGRAQHLVRVPDHRARALEPLQLVAMER
jgi:hypothetical protein